MDENYCFFDRSKYQPPLESFALTEDQYLTALREVTEIFPRESSLGYFQKTIALRGSLDHFDLLPTPNQLLPYHPVPILLHGPPTIWTLVHLVYLGLALRDMKRVCGRTKAYANLPVEMKFRAALFEIEVGAELARAGLRPTYSTKSPDFTIDELSLGVEARTREVPLSRAVAERMSPVCAFRDFRQLSIEITAKGEYAHQELVETIAKEVERLLTAVRHNQRSHHSLSDMI